MATVPLEMRGLRVMLLVSVPIVAVFVTLLIVLFATGGNKGARISPLISPTHVPTPAAGAGVVVQSD